MRKSIDTYVQGIAHDNSESIINGYESIADYIISNAENGTGYEEFFDDDELDETGEPTDDQIEELKSYLNENYGYIPAIALSDIAEENGLELVDTTSDRNGYPKDLKNAIIGFDTFEQAEKLAKETGLSIEAFKKRDGCDIWYRTGCKMGDPFLRTADDFGDDYRGYTKEDLDCFYENEVQPFVSDFDDFDSLRWFLDKMEKIKDEIEDSEYDELVLACCGEYYSTIKKRAMSYTYDTHHYAIGLIDRNKD